MIGARYLVASDFTLLLVVLCFLRTASVKQLPSWNVSCPQECLCSIVVSRNMRIELRTVDCRWSDLTETPSGIPGNTQVLVMANNNITSLLNLPDLSEILEMDWSGNVLKDISSKPLFGRFSSLKLLNLSNNYIKELHHGAFSGLKHLELLDLSFNLLHSIKQEDAFAGLNHLHVLHLGNNQITSVDEGWLQGMVHLKELHLNQNQISQINPKSVNILTDLTCLDLSENLITVLSTETFAGLTKLQQLDLSKNRISKIPTEVLQHLPNLADFMLSQNPITRIRTDDFVNMNVENVSLNFMPHLTLVEKSAFHNLTNLRILNMHHNRQLFFIDPLAFSNVPHLQWLRLQGDHLAALPQQVEESLPQLSEVHIYDNPLYCDCNIHWISQLILQAQSLSDNSSLAFIRFPHTDRILCDNPANLSVPVPLLDVAPDTIPNVCPPAAIPFFNDSNQLEVGETLRLECRALGIPTPKMHWILSNGQRLNSSTPHDRVSLEDESVLVLSHITAKDAGTYACEAKNDFGHDISSTAVKVHTSNIRVVILNQSKTYITITWSGTDSTVASSDYKILYNPAGDETGRKEIHIRRHHRTYTITHLTPDTSYELCVVYVHAEVYHKVHCTNISTLKESYIFPGITRISKQKVTMGVIIIFSLCFLGCVVALMVKRWRRKGYEKPQPSEAGDPLSQIPLENLYQPPSTPLCTSRTSLLPSSQA